MPDPVRSPHARLAALKRHQKASSAEIADAERALRVACAETYLRQLAGSLTLAQRARLAARLLDAPDGGAA